MEHLAIDLGGRESQFCLRSSEGSILREGRVATRSLDWLLERPKCRVVLETCAEAFAVADAALERGHEVRVVPASLVRTLGVGARKTKTDRRDARTLSEVSCRIDLPSVHVPSHWSRQVKSILGMRDALVQARTMLINTVRGWLRGRVQRLRGRGPSSFPTRVRARWREEKRELPAFVERQLQSIEQLSQQIVEANREVAKLAEEHEVCQRLMTLPGVGPVTALRLVSALDSVERFANAHQVESYLGLTPGEDSSSDRKRLTSITKAGSSAVRWTLVQACWSALRTKPSDPLSLWATGIARRRGPRIAIVAMARKMAGILYALWRDGTVYQPERASSMRAREEAEVTAA